MIQRPRPETRRMLRTLAYNPALLLSVCAAGVLSVQACGSSGSELAAQAATHRRQAHRAAAGSGTGTAGASGNGSSSAGASSAGASGGVATGGSGTGTGGSSTGTGGSTGSAGGSPTGGSGPTAGSGGAPAAGDNVLERNLNPSRDGMFIQPKLTKAAVPMLTADTAFAAKFTGNMWASPLYMSNGPNNKGAFFAVSTNNNVYAIDETTGAIIWTKLIGSAPQQSGAGCGQVNPVGITSTPVIDAVKRVIYVAGAVGTSQIDHHEIHAINIDTGMEVTGWPVDLTGTKSGSVTFSQKPQNQRSALSLVNGTLYVAYGGHVGDCSDYRGWVIGVDTADPTKRGGWVTLDTTGSGIWAAGGMASDGKAVFAATGNHTPFGQHASDRTTSDSEQVVRITGLGVLDRKDENLFFPTTWKDMDDSDADLGSSNPVYFSVPGATPPNYLVQPSKDGKLYILNAANLGGMNGAVTTVTVASSAMAVKTAPTVYRTAEGTHVTFATDSGASLPNDGHGSQNRFGIAHRQPTHRQGRLVCTSIRPSDCAHQHDDRWHGQCRGLVPERQQADRGRRR